MKDFIGIVLVGVGGYILYEWLFGTPATTVMAQPTPPATTSNATQNSTVGSTTGNQAGQNNQPNYNQATLAAMLVAAARNNGIMVSQGGEGTVSQWNYLFTQVTGDSVDILVDYPGDTGGNISVSTYMQWRQGAGLAGLGRVYMSGWAGKGFHGFSGFDMSRIPGGLASNAVAAMIHPGFGGLGEVGAGYGINQNRINAGASFYELADKRFL